jgi:hypothetical protein
MIVSILDKSAGFFSMFFFTVNHYLLAKKHNVKFVLHSDHWLFKSQKGWEDYFLNIDTNAPINHPNVAYLKHYQPVDKFTIHEYKKILPEMYKYNKLTKTKIDEMKMKLNLRENYDSIFIRRGDKLAWESMYIETKNFIEILLARNPNCHTIFLQTDDYNCYIDLQNYISENNLNIRAVTLCDESIRGGMIIFKANVDNCLKKAEINQDYISENMVNYQNCKPVNCMNSEEIYKHTMDMIIGIDIVLNSNSCVCDYQSNVSRFIKLLHKNFDSVVDILNPDLEIDMNRTECPAFGNFR